jgi:hypothetical protein
MNKNVAFHEKRRHVILVAEPFNVIIQPKLPSILLGFLPVRTISYYYWSCRGYLPMKYFETSKDKIKSFFQRNPSDPGHLRAFPGLFPLSQYLV